MQVLEQLSWTGSLILMGTSKIILKLYSIRPKTLLHRQTRKGQHCVDKSVGNRALKGTAIIVLVGILAKFASFISEAVLAAYLGTTYQSDAYYMVSSIQQVIYPMLSVGIWKVFLPLYKEKTTAGELRGADTLANKIITLSTIASLAAVALLILLAGPAVSLVAPGFEGETRTLCIQLVRLSAPMYVLIVAAAVYAAMLQCHDRFLGSQIREVVSHIPTILAAVLFYKAFGVKALAIALVVGGLLRLVVELPFVNWGYKYKPDFHFKTHELKIFAQRLPSAMISEGVTQVNTLVDKAMASMLPEGTVSSLNYGQKLVNVFSGLLSSAVATALYPQMIELIALKKTQELSRLVEKIINIFCVIMIPITVACILFRTELVSAVFQRGAFGAESVSVTAGVFALYCLGILFSACNTVINNLFYSFGNTRTPMYISIANLVINVAANLVFIHFWGVNGLALATSISAVFTFFVRMKLSGKYVEIHAKPMLRAVGKVLLASVAACGAPRLLFTVVDANKYVVLVASAAMGVALYFVLARWFKISELDEVLSLVRKRGKHGA